MHTSNIFGNAHSIRIGLLLFALLLGFGFALNASAQQSSPPLMITSPKEGTIISPGTQLPVTVSVSLSSNITGIEIIGQDMGIATVSAGPPFSTSITIPSNIVGQRTLVAVALTTSGSSMVSSPVTVDIEPSVEATALSVSPTQLSFEFLGQQLPLTVMGTFADGSTLDLTRSSRISYSSPGSSLTLDSTGLVTAADVSSGGNAAVTVTYQGLNATVSASVPNTTPGDLDGNGIVDQDDLNVLLDAIAAHAQVTGRFDARDLNHDGLIDFRDAIALEGLCNRPGCATHPPSSLDVPPVTVATITPSPNAQNWNNTDVTIAMTSTVNNSGAGVKQIEFSLSGAQQTITATPGNTASATISSEGITTFTYFGVGVDDATEKPQTLKIQIDKTPPTISGLPLPGCILWPPNHQMIQVATVTASDSLSGVAAFELAVASNEPTDPSNPDITVTGDGLEPRVVQLRAERLGTGAGRIYTLTTTATDIAGNTTTSKGTCVVPHDRGH